MQGLSTEHHIHRMSKLFNSLSGSFRLVWETNWLWTLLLLITTIFSGLLPSAIAWISKLIIDAVIQILGNPSQDISRLVDLTLLAFGIALVGQILSGVTQISQTLLRDALTRRISVMIIGKAAQLDLSYYETPSYYDMLQRAQQEMSFRPLIILQQLFSVIRSAVTLVSLSLLLIRFSPWILVLLVITGAPALFVQSLYGQANYKLQNRRTTSLRKLMYYVMLLTGKQYVKEIKLFNLSLHFIDRYKEHANQYYKEDRILAIKRTIANIIFQAVSSIGYYFTYFLIILQTISRQNTLGDLTMFSGILLQSQSTLASLLTSISDTYEQQLFLNNLFDFLNLQPSQIPVKEQVTITDDMTRPCIELRNVSFRYPNAKKCALENINLTIHPGEKVALVGSNGSGKTTLIKLIAGLYDPMDGTVLLNDVDLRRIERASLHTQMGVIFQDYAQYHLSGYENIGVGKIESLSEIPRIEQAAVMSGIDRTLSHLPNGYSTILGRWFDDKGQDLSLGEWQRVALSRAYMRDAPILILDEPTASIDAQSEYEFFKQIKQLVKNKMIIIISHRFSTVRLADRIIVMENGRIVEQGSHQELLDKKGLYATMFNLQAEGYR